MDSSSGECKCCSRCGKLKPLAEYYNNKKAKDGKFSHCKACHDSAVSEYRRDNAVAVRERNARWRANHREQARATQHRYAEKNRAEQAKRIRHWRQQNPEKAAAHNRLNWAVYEGLISKPKACQNCGATGQIEGHHFDYSKPLDVWWLCSACHRLEDFGLRDE